MLKDFILPDIGEGIVECELVEWLVSEGDLIEEDQPIADIMTDKALVQIPAPFSGRVVKLYYQQGDNAKVHQPLFSVELDASTNESAVIESAEPVDSVKSIPELTERLENAGAEATPEEFILPDIGEGMVECEVVEWLVAEGDPVQEDQPVVDVMTDKALVQIPAPKSGVISRLYYAQGDNAKVHQPLFAFVADDAPSESTSTKTASAGQHREPDTNSVNDSASRAPLVDPANQQSLALGPSMTSGKALASPAVRRIARDYQVNIAQVSGTGRDGRVLKEDMLRYVGQLEPTNDEPSQTADKISASVNGENLGDSSAEPAVNSRSVSKAEGIRVEPIRGVKAAMARQMTLAATTIPHFTYGDEVDVTALLALRQQLKPKAEAQGIRLTLMPLIMKALAIAVQQYPIVNSRLNDDVTEIHYLPDCNIGMAVDSRVGLLVPNIKSVHRLSVLEVAAEVQRITESARSGRVSQTDLQGGTISISNIGALGGTYAVPVINAPEVAIVVLGKIQQLPRFDEAGQVVARSIMNISWSGDHRVIDGATIARFSGLWQSYLEDPSLMLLELS